MSAAFKHLLGLPMNAGVGARVPSTAYRFFFPAQQEVGSGNVVDESGKGNDGILGADLTDAECWSNSGYFSTGESGGVDAGINLPLAAHQWDMAAGESLIIGLYVNASKVLSNDGIFGSVNGGAQPGVQGFSWSASGNVRMRISDGVNGFDNLTDIPAALDDTEHMLMFAIDGVTKLGYSFLDGVLEGAAADLSDTTGSTVPAVGFNFGNDTGVGAPLLKFKEIHYLVLSGALPSNISDIANLMATRQGVPLSVAEVGI